MKSCQIDFEPVGLREQCPADQSLLDCVRQLGIDMVSLCGGEGSCGHSVEKAPFQEQEHSRIRTLPIDSDTLSMLKDYIKRGGPVSRGNKRLIFGINRHRAWQMVRDCADRAGLGDLVNPTTGKKRGVSPHRLRDAFAVHAAKLNDSGDVIRLLQEHLGHASFNIKAKYRKVAGEEHREWYEELWRKGEDGG